MRLRAKMEAEGEITVSHKGEELWEITLPSGKKIYYTEAEMKADWQPLTPIGIGLDGREQRLLEDCLYYVEHPYGAPGHLYMTLIAKLARAVGL